jgi:excisionase family DNA binding protein
MRDGSDTNGDRLNISSIAECPPSRTSLLLTIPEAAAALRVSRSSIYRLFDSGELSWVQICGKRRVSNAEINRFIAAHTEVA